MNYFAFNRRAVRVFAAMKTKKIRLIYLAITPLVVVLGLSSRKFDESLPAFIADYAGDTLWALMVFLGISFLLPDLPVMKREASPWPFPISSR